MSIKIYRNLMVTSSFMSLVVEEKRLRVEEVLEQSLLFCRHIDQSFSYGTKDDSYSRWWAETLGLPLSMPKNKSSMFQKSPWTLVRFRLYLFDHVSRHRRFREPSGKPRLCSSRREVPVYAGRRVSDTGDA